MKNPIYVERIAIPNYPESILTPAQRDMISRGVVATITLSTSRAAAYLFEGKLGGLRFVHGSRALFGRWIQSLKTGPDPRD
jgi:hypothetical protein